MYAVADLQGFLQPLMEAGLDSLGAVELRNQLAATFPSAELSATLTFDHPSIRALATFIASQQTLVTEQQASLPSQAQGLPSQRAGTQSAEVLSQVLLIIEGMLGKAVEPDQVSSF